MTSVSGTSSNRMSPTPCHTTAFMSCPPHRRLHNPLPGADGAKPAPGGGWPCMAAARRGRGWRMTSNPIQLQKYLGGVDYPTDKETLVEHARGKGADDDVLQTLQDLPFEEFNSPNDVSEA